jgi:hydroxymethylpyrimidine/phosphomethylpyrimidine kinase
MVSAIRELLVPQSTVITPNIPELRRLAQAEEDEDSGLAEYAQRLLDTAANTCS